MLGRIQPQKSFGDKALELHVCDRHFLVKVERLIDWTVLDVHWPDPYGRTGKPFHDTVATNE